MKIIDNSKLKSLLIDSERLRRLDYMGVDNWDWYGEAIFHNPDGDLEDWEENNLPKILESYQDYQPKEFENYNIE